MLTYDMKSQMTICDVLPRRHGKTHDKFNRIVKVIEKAIIFFFLKHFFNPKLKRHYPTLPWFALIGKNTLFIFVVWQ